jgi:glycosyltransferase involved in cell wall biosynthesis
VARRILLFITDLEIGGTPTVVREIATRLNAPQEGVEVEVACLSGWGPVADQLRDAGLNVTALGITSRLQVGRAVRKLTALIRERSIDTVFSFLVHANAIAANAAVALSADPAAAVAAAAAAPPRVRFLQSIQTTQPKPRWHWWVQRKVQAQAEKVVVPSPSAAQVARERAGVPAEKVVIIPNAIDVARFSSVAAERETYLARRRAIEPGTRVGFLGRLDPVKRVCDLIRAMRHLGGAQLRPYQLHVFGDGALRTTLERQARRELTPAQVHYEFRGPVDSPGEALKQVDLLVLPSAAEGFGLVLIEAMAAGVPVVATDVMGIRDVVDHERTGLLGPPRNPKKLAEAIERLCEDDELRRRMVLNGFEEVRGKYNWDAVMRQYREVLRIA